MTQFWTGQRTPMMELKPAPMYFNEVVFLGLVGDFGCLKKTRFKWGYNSESHQIRHRDDSFREQIRDFDFQYRDATRLKAGMTLAHNGTRFVIQTHPKKAGLPSQNIWLCLKRGHPKTI
jgi:hypothetical protein